jgi:integral membrane protein (TIGR01906 family)
MRKSLVLLIVLFSFLPLSLSFYLSVFNTGFYEDSFSKYNVYEKYPSVDDYNSEVLSYLKGNRDSMPSSIELNARELEHMKDVRNVFFGFNLFFLSLMLLILLLIVYRRKDILNILQKVLSFSGLVSLVLGIFLAGAFYFAFNSSFTVFHKLLFPQGGWLFSSTDNIINIYPSGLFFDIFLRVFILMIIFSLLFVAVGRIGARRKVKKK